MNACKISSLYSIANIHSCFNYVNKYIGIPTQLHIYKVEITANVIDAVFCNLLICLELTNIYIYTSYRVTKNGEYYAERSTKRNCMYLWNDIHHPDQN